MASNKIIDIDNFRFKKINTRFYDRENCQHKNTTIDQNGRTLVCDDCSKSIDPLWMLETIIESLDRARDSLNHKNEILNNAIEKEVSLIAAQKVEKSWRSRSMVPTCPHCHAGIFPSDGFGGSSTNKEFELARRANKKTK